MSDCPQVRPKELVGNVAAGSTDPCLVVFEFLENQRFIVLRASRFAYALYCSLFRPTGSVYDSGQGPIITSQ